MNRTENGSELYEYDYDSVCEQPSSDFTSGSTLFVVLYYVLFSLGLTGKILMYIIYCIQTFFCFCFKVFMPKLRKAFVREIYAFVLDLSNLEKLSCI